MSLSIPRTVPNRQQNIKSNNSRNLKKKDAERGWQKEPAGVACATEGFVTKPQTAFGYGVSGRISGCCINVATNATDATLMHFLNVADKNLTLMPSQILIGWLSKNFDLQGLMIFGGEGLHQ
jgi:hypothetical protein